MEVYAERNDLLRELGFKDYKTYLRSSLWKGIRQRKLELDPNCYGCDRNDSTAILQIHHSAYTRENLTGNSLEHLWTLCDRCHRWCEVTRAGYKRDPFQATKEMFRVRKLMLSRRHMKYDTHALIR